MKYPCHSPCSASLVNSTNSCTSTRPSYIPQRCAVTNTKGVSYSIMPWLFLPLHEKEDVQNTCFDDLKLPSSCFHIPCGHKTWALVFARLCKIACRANQHSSYLLQPMVNVVAQSEVSFLRTTELEFIRTLKWKNKENSKLREEIKLPCK